MLRKITPPQNSFIVLIYKATKQRGVNTFATHCAGKMCRALKYIIINGTVPKMTECINTTGCVLEMVTWCDFRELIITRYRCIWFSSVLAASPTAAPYFLHWPFTVCDAVICLVLLLLPWTAMLMFLIFSCPPGYAGLSCEKCSSGFERVPSGSYLGTCAGCNCNGHAMACDPISGHCLVRPDSEQAFWLYDWYDSRCLKKHNLIFFRGL